MTSAACLVRNRLARKINMRACTRTARLSIYVSGQISRETATPSNTNLSATCVWNFCNASHTMRTRGCARCASASASTARAVSSPRAGSGSNRCSRCPAPSSTSGSSIVGCKRPQSTCHVRSTATPRHHSDSGSTATLSTSAACLSSMPAPTPSRSGATWSVEPRRAAPRHVRHGWRHAEHARPVEATSHPTSGRPHVARTTCGTTRRRSCRGSCSHKRHPEVDVRDGALLPIHEHRQHVQQRWCCPRAHRVPGFSRRHVSASRRHFPAAAPRLP